MGIDSCLIVTLPIHLSHKSQTFWITLQVQKRCWAFSKCSRNKGHKMHPIGTPLRTKLSLAGNLSHSILQAHTKADESIFKLHSNWKHSKLDIWSSISVYYISTSQCIPTDHPLSTSAYYVIPCSIGHQISFPIIGF